MARINSISIRDIRVIRVIRGSILLQRFAFLRELRVLCGEWSLNPKLETRNTKQMPMTKAQNPKLPEWEWEGIVSGIWSFDFDIVSNFGFMLPRLCRLFEPRQIFHSS